ncbi:hypothetical protein LTR28_011580 [Elasticomyces elasticus]|nr:hypothetical protein LTR28_011580 [Elasticomyces elasticus]
MIGPCAKRAKKAAARKATFDFLRLPRARKPRGAIYVRAVAARKKLETDETILCLCKHLGNLIEDRNEWSLGADDWTDAVDICKGADREYGYGELGR